MNDPNGCPQQRGRVQAQPFGGQSDPIQHAGGLIGRRGSGLGNDGLAVQARNDNIGERAADVDADRVGHAVKVNLLPVVHRISFSGISRFAVSRKLLPLQCIGIRWSIGSFFNSSMIESKYGCCAGAR